MLLLDFSLKIQIVAMYKFFCINLPISTLMHLLLKTLELVSSESSQNEINIDDINLIEFEPLEYIVNDSTNIDQDTVQTSPQSSKVINYCNSLIFL